MGESRDAAEQRPRANHQWDARREDAAGPGNEGRRGGSGGSGSGVRSDRTPPAAADSKLRSASTTASGRKRSRSSESLTRRDGGSSSRGVDAAATTAGAELASPPAPAHSCSTNSKSNMTPSRRIPGIREATPMTPGATPIGSAAADVAVDGGDADGMFGDSSWEREIAGLGRILDEMLARVSNRDLVRQAAEYIRSHPQHSLRFQIKMKQRALGEATRQFQSKLMLFYVFHEFLKSFSPDELRTVQREWYMTVDEVLHACVRDVRNNDDGRKRLFKTLARWEELNIYPQKIKQWKALVMGETKPRRGPMRLPRNEAERLAEAPDQLQQFPPPPVNQVQLQINRTNYPIVFERSDFRSAYDLKQHWRYSAVAFIEVLGQCLGISRDIALTASMYFHRVFDRGMYAKERYKFAAACIFLSAKASSKRMKLLRMAKTMHEILETPLLVGDEEILDLERMQLLFYEIEVLKGIDFELTTDLPFYYLRETLAQMPDKFRADIEEATNNVLEELFWLPLCLSTRPSFLAEAAAYIACRNKDRIFSFSWCREDKHGNVLTEKAAKEILREYRSMVNWKKDQRRHFDILVRTSSSTGGNGPWDLHEVFRDQRGGLRLDVSTIQLESEYTEKGVNEGKETLSTYDDVEPECRGRNQDRRRDHESFPSTSREKSNRRSDDDEPVMKDERRAYSSRDRDDRLDRDRRNDSEGYVRDRGESRYQGRNSSREYSRDRQRDRSRDQDGTVDRDRQTSRYEREEVYVKEERYIKQERNTRRSRDYSSERDRRSRDYETRRDRSPHIRRDEARTNVGDRDRSREPERPSDRRREKEVDRGRSKDEGCDRDRDVERSNVRSRDRTDDREPERGRVRDRTRDREREDRAYTPKYVREIDHDRHRSREPSRERSRDRGRSGDRDDRDYSRSGGQERETKYSRRSRSSSPRESLRSRKQRRRSPSRSRSRSRSMSNSRDRTSSSSRRSRTDYRERTGQTRSHSASRDRERYRDRDRPDGRSAKYTSERKYDQDYAKIKDEIGDR